MSMRRSAALLIARSHRWCHVIHTAVRRGKYWTRWGDVGGKGDWQFPKLQALFYLPFSSGCPAIALVHLPSYQFKWRRLSCARFDCLPRLHYRLRQDWAWACYWLAGCLSLCLSPPTPPPPILPSQHAPFIYRLVTFSNRTESLRQFCECLAQSASNSNLRSLRLSIVALGLPIFKRIPCRL